MDEHSDIPSKTSYFILIGFAVVSLLLKFYQYTKTPPTEITRPEYIISILISLSIIFLIYIIAKAISGENLPALFAASIAIFTPMFTWKTVNFLNHTLSVVFLLLALLAIIYIKDTPYWRTLMIIPLLLALISIYSLMLIPLFLLFFGLIVLERKKISKREYIFAGVSSAIILGVFIFLTSTPALFILAQNYVATGYYSLDASHFTITAAFLTGGLIPVYLGAMGAYYAIPKKKKSTLLLISASAVMILALLLNFIPLTNGMPYLILLLCCFSSEIIIRLKKVLINSRIREKAEIVLFVVFAIVFLLNLIHFFIS